MSGITDPKEAYFKDGIWGWDGAAWHKLPMVWGYSDHLAGLAAKYGAELGADDVLGTPCPAGEVWIVESIDAHDSRTNLTLIQLFVYDGVGAALVEEGDPADADRHIYWTGRITLHPGDLVYAHYIGTTINDNLYLRWWGYKMKVAE